MEAGVEESPPCTYNIGKIDAVCLKSQRVLHLIRNMVICQDNVQVL